MVGVFLIGQLLHVNFSGRLCACDWRRVLPIEFSRVQQRAPPVLIELGLQYLNLHFIVNVCRCCVHPPEINTLFLEYITLKGLLSQNVLLVYDKGTQI